MNYLQLRSIKNICLILIASLVLTACEKEEELQLDYPSLYRSVRYENTSKVRLFTVNSEITNQEVIKQFIERHKQFSEEYLYSNGVVTKPSQSDSIRILNSTSAQIQEGVIIKDYLLTKQGNELNFIDRDTVRLLITDEYLANLQMAIGKYKYFYQNKRETPSQIGVKYEYDIIQGKYATASSNSLDFPLVNYVLILGTGTNQGIKNKFNNRFDSNAYKQLRSGDTLAVQELNIRYEK